MAIPDFQFAEWYDNLMMGFVPQTIITKNKDTMSFVSGIVPTRPQSATGSYNITLKGIDDSVAYQFTPTAENDKMKEGQRLFLFGRITSEELLNGLKVCCYIDSVDDADETTIKPLREVYTPSVTYDADSNNLVLWFWCNFKESYNGTEYDEEEIVPIIDDTSAEDLGAKKVLCHAIGQIVHLNMEGGNITGLPTGVQGADPSYDLVPLFMKPRLVNFLGANKGVVADIGGGGSGGASDTFLARITGGTGNSYSGNILTSLFNESGQFAPVSSSGTINIKAAKMYGYGGLGATLLPNAIVMVKKNTFWYETVIPVWM